VTQRLAILLTCLLVPSALYLVGVRHESRQLFAALERAKREQKQLGDEAIRLQARRTELTSAMAAERGAEKLGMRVAGADVIWYVTDPTQAEVGTPAIVPAGQAASALMPQPTLPVLPVLPASVPIIQVVPMVPQPDAGDTQ
jgi:cell division protein FtsL